MSDVIFLLILLCIFESTDGFRYGGVTATRNEHEENFMSLRFPEAHSKSDQHKCGATILHFDGLETSGDYNYGVTTATCLCTDAGRLIDDWGSHTVLCGQYFDQPAGPSGNESYIRRSLISATCHPDYRGLSSAKYPNLAWFRVNETVHRRVANPMVTVHGICPDALISSMSTSCWLFGFGEVNQNGARPEALQGIAMTIHTNESDCGITQEHTPDLVGKVICTTFHEYYPGQPDPMAGEGDSGCPMICENPTYRLPRCVAGFVSNIQTFPQMNKRKLIFTKLSAYPSLRDWMAKLPFRTTINQEL